MKQRKIRVTYTLYEPILEEGQDEREVIGEMLDRSGPPGSELLDWQFISSVGGEDNKGSQS